jgi:hypothetical protein
MSTMGIEAALEAVNSLGVVLNDYDSEALDTLCLWVSRKLKQERDELEREEDYTRNKEENSNDIINGTIHFILSSYDMDTH